MTQHTRPITCFPIALAPVSQTGNFSPQTFFGPHQPTSSRQDSNHPLSSTALCPLYSLSPHRLYSCSLLRVHLSWPATHRRAFDSRPVGQRFFFFWVLVVPSCSHDIDSVIKTFIQLVPIGIYVTCIVIYFIYLDTFHTSWNSPYASCRQKVSRSSRLRGEKKTASWDGLNLILSALPSIVFIYLYTAIIKRNTNFSSNKG